MDMNMPEFVDKVYWKIRYTLGLTYNWELGKREDKWVRNIDLNNLSLPTAIEIETLNRCNGKCSFCPVNATVEQRPYAKMSGALFKKIIDELKGLSYSGRLALFSNNEPYLDERIIEFMKYARESVPDAYLYVYTNGTMLTLDKYKESMKYLDEIYIDNYSDDRVLLPVVKEIKEYIENEKPEYLLRTIIDMRLQNQMLFSRGGQAPNRIENLKKIKTRCSYPYLQMVIRPDGKVSLCCNDAKGVYTMGDLNESAIIDVWYSHNYKEIRQIMMDTGRKNLNLCQYCDTVGDVLQRAGRRG